MAVTLTSTGIQFSDGTSLSTAPSSGGAGAIIFASKTPGSGTFTVPDTGVYWVSGCGGGGSGGGGNGSGATGGAPGAAVNLAKFTATPGASVSYTIGAGAPQGGYDKNGSAGSATTVGSMSLGGGGGGSMYYWTAAGAAGAISGLPTTYFLTVNPSGYTYAGASKAVDIPHAGGSGYGGAGVVNGGNNNRGGDGFLIVISGE